MTDPKAAAESLILRLRGANPDEGDQICEDAATMIESLLRAQAAASPEPVAQVVSSGQWDMPVLQWMSADHSFRVSIGSKLYAHPPASAERIALLEAKIAKLQQNPHVCCGDFAECTRACAPRGEWNVKERIRAALEGK